MRNFSLPDGRKPASKHYTLNKMQENLMGLLQYPQLAALPHCI